MAERISGLSIGLDLDDTGITRSLSEIKRSFKMFDSEMKTNFNNFKVGSKTVETYEKSMKDLTKTVDNQRKNLNDLESKREEAIKNHGEHSAQVQNLTTDINKQRDSLNYYEHQLDKTTEELKELQREQRIAESSFTKMGNSFNKIGDDLQTVGKGMKDIGKSMSMYVTAPLVGFGVLATKTGIDFDDAMSKVKAISGATGDELADLRDKAREVGANTKFSATEAAEGFNYMALAGWKTSDMLDGIDGMMMLAAASGEDLGRVSDIVTDGLSAFGLEARDSGRMADVLAAASANANTDVAGLGDAFEYVAPVAGALGFSIEDTSKAIGLMANSGIKGQKAGTALRTMMTNLAKPTKQMQKAMDELGISLTDSDGNMKDLDTIMGELRGSFSGLTKDQQANYAATIFGKEAMSGALAIINESEENFDNLGDAIANSAGEAERMGKEMEDNLGGSLRQLKSVWEETMLGIYDVMEPVVRKVVDWIAELLNKFTGISDELKRTFVVIGLVAGAIGPLLVAGGTMIMWLGGLMKAISPVLLAIGEMGGLLPALGTAFSVLTGPIGITVLAIAGLATGFGIAYTKSETFREMIGNVISKVKEGITWIKDFSLAIVNLFKNDDEKGNQLLDKLGLSEEKVVVINSVIGSIKQAFNKMKEVGVQAFNAVGNFFGEMVGKLHSFWSENGAQVMQAIHNSIKVIGKIIEFVMPVVKTVFIAGFKIALFLVQEIWGNIKGVISGALDIILGTVKVFSSLFTGDFRGMWNGVKQIFSGAISFVWNLFSLMFYGRILKGVGSLVKLFSGSIRGLWTSVVGFFKNMFTGSVNQVSSLYTKTINFGNLIKSGLGSAISGAKTRVVNLFSTMKTRSLEHVNKIVEGVKSLPGKMKDALVNGKNKVTDGIKALGNSMADTLGKVVNGVIGGINTVMSKIGIDKKLTDWSVPEFSRGTGQGSPSGKLTRSGKIAIDTLATVGDKGPGNGQGTRELVHYPNGQVGLYDDDATIFAPKGTTIFSNKETEALLGQIPQFSKGTGFFSSIKNIASKAIDYITNPSKIFNAIVDNYMQAWSVAGFAKDLGKGAWKNIKSGLLEWVKSRFSEAGAGKKQKWMDRFPITTPYSPNAPVPGYPRSFNNGHHYGIDWGTTHGTNLTSPIAGQVSRQSDHGGGNVARVDYGKGSLYFLHMNSVKPGKVGIGDSLGFSGNTGAFTTGPHVHVQDENPKTSFLMNKNTRDPLKLFNSHLKGGYMLSDGLVNLHKGEYIINPSEPSQAMKLIALAAEKIKGKSKQTSQLPLTGAMSDNSLLLEMIKNQQEQINLLTQLINKDSNVYLNDKRMNKELAPGMQQELNLLEKRQVRFT